jgi:inner membrane protein YidH
LISKEKIYRHERHDLILRDFLAADRTILANERTFLAYIRTALSLIVAGASFVTFSDITFIVITGYLFFPAAFYILITGFIRFFQIRHKLSVIKH